MQGTQSQSSNLPFKHTDFIFSVAGEELGMIGCAVIIFLLVAIIIRCIYVGVKSKSYMNMLICTGIASMLIFQTFENIGMCIGITPVIGITLPFFSYGGSSIVTTFASLGIVSGIRMRPNLVSRR
jgi:rod shape determining protein RodA